MVLHNIPMPRTQTPPDDLPQPVTHQRHHQNRLPLSLTLPALFLLAVIALLTIPLITQPLAHALANADSSPQGTSGTPLNTNTTTSTIVGTPLTEPKNSGIGIGRDDEEDRDTKFELVLLADIVAFGVVVGAVSCFCCLFRTFGWFGCEGVRKEWIEAIEKREDLVWKVTIVTIVALSLFFVLYSWT